VRRITEGAGLKRSGSRIQDAVQKAIMHGVRQSKLLLKGDIVWHPDMETPEVRDRSGLEANAKKLELVAPEEIRAAIENEVKRSFSMTVEDAAVNAGRALGFQRVTSQARALLDVQLEHLVKDGVLTIRGDIVSPVVGA